MENKDLGKVTTEEERKAISDKLPFYKNWRFYVYTFIALCLSFLAVSSLLNGCALREVQKHEESKTSLVDHCEPHSLSTPSDFMFDIDGIFTVVPSADFSRAYYFPYSDYSNDGDIYGSAINHDNKTDFRLRFTYLIASDTTVITLYVNEWNIQGDFFLTCSCYSVGGVQSSPVRYGSNQWSVDGALKEVVFSSRDRSFVSYYQGLVNGYSSGYSSGSSDGYSSGYSEGYQDGSSHGYSSGYSEGYQDGSSDGYSSGYSAGYSTGFSSGVDYGENIVVSGEFYLGQKLESVLFPVDFNAQAVYNDLYTGSEFQRAEIQFDDGTYIERFERVSSVGDLPYRQVGYRYLYNNGSGIVPFFSVIRQTTDDNTVTYIRMVQNNGGVGRLVFADYGGTSAKVVNFLYYMQQHKSVSQLTPGVENGYAQGYADGSSIGYINGLNDANPSALTETLAVVFQQPFNIIWRFLNFNVLGLNLLALACGLITLFIVIKVVKKIV